MGKKTSVNPGVFFCQICRKRLSVGSKYNHMQTHTEVPTVNFACADENCSKTFSTKSGLRNHEKLCWRDCSAHTESDERNRHITQHKAEPKSYCRECKMTFATRKQLLAHRGRSHQTLARPKNNTNRKPIRQASDLLSAVRESNRKEKDWLRVKLTKNKGRGVFARRPFLPKQIICEYVGELINANVLALRKADATYDTSYLFEFKHNSTKPIAIDALRENKTIGRLINHTRVGDPNCRPVKIVDDLPKPKPHIAFEATRIIHIGDELLYDYEDRESQVDWIWNS